MTTGAASLQPYLSAPMAGSDWTKVVAAATATTSAPSGHPSTGDKYKVSHYKHFVLKVSAGVFTSITLKVWGCMDGDSGQEFWFEVDTVQFTSDEQWRPMDTYYLSKIRFQVSAIVGGASGLTFDVWMGI